MQQLNKFTRPVVTGTPSAGFPSPANGQKQAEPATSFLQVLQQKLEAGSNTAFSKHAVNRVYERKIDVSDQNLQRLSHGIELAQSKGLRDALILIDQNAYIVNAATAKVITVDGQAEKGSVFTNIDGTVIV